MSTTYLCLIGPVNDAGVYIVAAKPANSLSHRNKHNVKFRHKQLKNLCHGAVGMLYYKKSRHLAAFAATLRHPPIPAKHGCAVLPLLFVPWQE